MVLLTSLLAEIPPPVHAIGSREIITTVTRTKMSRDELENETNVVPNNKSHSCYKRTETCCEGRNTKCKGLLTENTHDISTKACYCDDSCTLLKGSWPQNYDFVIFQVIQ